MWYSFQTKWKEDGRTARTTMITEENDTLLLLPDELNLYAY